MKRPCATIAFTSIADFGVDSALGRGTAGTSISFGNGSTSSGRLEYIGSTNMESNRTITFAGTAAAAAGQIFNNGTGTLTFDATTFNTGTGSGNRYLTLGGSNTDNNIISGIIANQGSAALNITKTDLGTWILGGNNSYTGATAITGGLLRFDGVATAASNVSISAGTAMGGAGTVLGTVAAALGTATTSGGAINLYNGTAGQSLTLGSTLTFSGTTANPNNLYFELGAGATGTDKIVLSTANALPTAAGGVGSVIINLKQLAGTPDAGPYTVIQGGAGSTFVSTNYALATTAAFGNTYSLGASGTNLQVTVGAGTAGDATAFWTGAADTSWNGANWQSAIDSGSAATVGFNTDVTFTSTTPVAGNLSTVLDAGYEIRSLTFNTDGITIGDSTRSLTINNAAGITTTNGSGTNTISAKVGLGVSQTWTVATGGTLTVTGGVNDFGNGFSLTKAGGGDLNISGALNYSGDTTISGGTLTLDGTLGNNATYTRDIVNNGTELKFTNAGQVLSGIISGSGALNATLSSGTATLTLSGGNSYSGATTIASGRVSIDTIANAGSNSGIGAFAAAGATGLLLQGGMFTYTGATATTNRGFTLSGASTINVSAAGTILTMGDATINGGTLTVIGGTDSSLALGTVTQNANLSFVTATGNKPISIQSIILNPGSFSLNPVGNSPLTVGDITGTNQNYTFGGASGNITGNIALGTGTLTKSGSGTWTLTGLSSYSGVTTINNSGGGITFNTIKDVGGGNSSLGAPTTALNGTIAFNGGTLRYTGTGDSTNRVINLNATALALNMSGTGTLTFTSAFTGGSGTKTLTLTGSTAGIGELAGALVNGTSGTNAITKTGTGTWVLSGNSSGGTGYTGATTVSAGRLHVTGSLKSAVTVANGAILSGTGSTTSTLALSNGSTIVGTTAGSSFQANTVTATSAVTIAGSDGSGTIGSHTIGVVRYATGAGPTTGNFSTAGYRSASVANVGGSGGETQLTYTNAARTWDSASGTWDAMSTNAWQESDLKYSQGDAVTFDDSGTGGGSARAVTLNALVTPGSVTFNNSTSTPYTVSGTGTIHGLTALTKSGTGTVTLSNANTYTGATTVNGGALLVDGSTHASSAVTVAAGTLTGAPVATLGGTGTIGGNVSLATESVGGFKNGGVLAPTAAATGTALKVTGTTTFTTGSLFEWNMAATTPATDPGVVANSGSYGQLAGTGAITGSNAVFNIALGAGNDFTDNFWNSNKSWTDVFTGAGATLDLTSMFASFGGTGVDTAGVVTGIGTFSFTGTSTLNWTAVPEPTSALAGLLLGAGLLRRRRNVG